MSYERSINVPMDVLNVDDYLFMVPNGISLKVEPLLKAGVKSVTLAYRNVSLTSYSKQQASLQQITPHPLFPVTEVWFLMSRNKVVFYSQDFLELLGLTFENLHMMYAEDNPWIRDIDYSQLSFSDGKLQIGEAISEEMMIVWTGEEFVAMPMSAKLPEGAETVAPVKGNMVEGILRCKYGMIPLA